MRILKIVAIVLSLATFNSAAQAETVMPDFKLNWADAPAFFVDAEPTVRDAMRIC